MRRKAVKFPVLPGDRFRAGKRLWTAEEDAALREKFPDMRTADVARELRRTPESVTAPTGWGCTRVRRILPRRRRADCAAAPALSIPASRPNSRKARSRTTKAFGARAGTAAACARRSSKKARSPAEPVNS